MAFLPDVLQKSRYVQQVQSFVTKCMNDWSLTLSGALAYSLLLSTIPIIAALLSILGLLLGNLGYDTLARVTQAISSVFPPEVHVAEIVQAIVRDLEQSSGVLGVIAVLSALFFGSRLFLLLEACFAIIYQVRPRSLLPQNVMAVGMMLAFILLVPLMVLSSTFPAWVFSLVPQTFLERIPFFSVLQSFLGGVIPAFLFFELIYVIVPNRHIQLRHGWPGALLAAAALQIYLQFFPFYVTHFLSGIIGVFGFTAILLVFYYYFAVILLIGAEVNAFFTEGVGVIPNDVATLVSLMAMQLHEDVHNSDE